jgi:hypothetical protein
VDLSPTEDKRVRCSDDGPSVAPPQIVVFLHPQSAQIVPLSSLASQDFLAEVSRVPVPRIFERPRGACVKALIRLIALILFP